MVTRAGVVIRRINSRVFRRNIEQNFCFRKTFCSTWFLVTRAGVEPTTFSLGRSCSIQLSYQATSLHYTTFLQISSKSVIICLWINPILLPSLFKPPTTPSSSNLPSKTNLPSLSSSSTSSKASKSSKAAQKKPPTTTVAISCASRTSP